MQIFFINNDGGGFADHINIRDGLTIRSLFEERMKGTVAEDYLIRVNRQPAPASQVLQEGDRVSVTPTKIHGA